MKQNLNNNNINNNIITSSFYRTAASILLRPTYSPRAPPELLHTTNQGHNSIALW